jgi:hypothetical protein
VPKGRVLATPRIRRLMTALAPTSSAIPIACSDRRNQKPNREPESRIQLLSAVSSIVWRKAGGRMAFYTPEATG